MRCKSTLSVNFHKSIFSVIAFFSLLTLIYSNSYAQQARQRVYATTQTNDVTGICVLCGITNDGSAVDNGTANGTNTASTITVGVSLLGGTAYQNLIFPANNRPSPGTGAVVKIGAGSALEVNALGAISARLYNGNTPVGDAVDAGSSLLNLLASGNQGEIFLPAPGVVYDRVRITVNGGLLSAVSSINVFHAYFLTDATSVNCDQPIDELHGVAGSVGALGVVNNPLNAIDNSPSTYSTLNAAVGLLGAYAQQTLIFSGESVIGDSVQLVVSTPSSLLDVQVLNSISIQTFNGNTTGDLVSGTGGLLRLRLLSGVSNTAVITFAPSTVFDRVQVRLGGVASVLPAINLHQVRRIIPTTVAINGTVSNSATVCIGQPVTLNIANPQTGVLYNWYTQPTGGTAVSGNSFSPASLVPGTNRFYIEATRSSCNNAPERKEIIVNVLNAVAPTFASLPEVCVGSTAVLSVSDPVQGQTYRWYESETGGSPINTGTSFTTPALTANATYFVEAVLGDCVSERVAVNVIASPLPAQAELVTNNVVINSGQTATLQASADAATTIRWFSAIDGGVELASGPTFTTPVLTTTTTYYIETANAAGCVNPTRVPVTVTVEDVVPTTDCNAANRQSTGTSGLLCVLCNVTGAGNSVDNDPATFTRITLSVGVGATGYQRLIFPEAGAATDSVRVNLGLPTGLADVNVLGGIRINVMNGNTVVSSTLLNSSLINLQLLGGGRFSATVPATAAYDRVEVRFGATVAVLGSLDIYGADIIYPNPTLASFDSSICSGETVTLSATANGGTSLAWYAAPTGGTALQEGNSFTTPALNASTTYYIEVSKDGCVNPVRVPVLITVNPAISFNATTLNTATNGVIYSRQIDPATGGTPAFTYALAEGSTLPEGLALSTSGLISGTSVGTAGNYQFTVVATDAEGCTASATYSLTIAAALVLNPGTLPDGTTSVPYPPQTIPAATGGTGPYTYEATNLPPGLTFDPVTREVSGTPTEKGTFSIPVTVTDANGNTTTGNYVINIIDPLQLPNAALATGTVGRPYPTQVIPAAIGGTAPYTYSATGLPAGLSFNPQTREITGTPTTSGTSTVVVTVTDNAGRTASNNYSIGVINPLVLPPATLASGSVGVNYPAQTIPEATGGVGPYTYEATGVPAGLTFDPVTRAITGTPTRAGNFVVTVTVRDAQNNTASNTYALNVTGALTLPTATLANGNVGVGYPTQTLPAVSGGTAPYTYVATNLPPGLNFNTTTREITGTPTLGGTFTLSLTATDATGNVISTDYVINVGVNPPVVAAVEICSGSTAALTVSNPQSGVTYNWYAATGDSPLATNNNGTFVTGTLNQSTTFYVQAVSGSALSSRTAVDVTVNALPTAPQIVNNNLSINSGETATLQASATSGNTIRWYAQATGGTPLSTSASFTTPVLNSTTTFYAESTNASGCSSSTRTSVTVTVTDGEGNANCYAATRQNSGTTGLLCVLCGVTGPNNSVDANPNNFTRITLSVGVGASGYQRLIFAQPGVATDSIRLDLATPTGLADLSVLGGITVNVMNGASVIRSYPLNSSLLNLKLLGGNRFGVTVPAGSVYDRVEVRFNATVSALSSLDIYGANVVYPSPIIAADGRTICAGNSTTLVADATGGTALAWYDQPAGGTLLESGESFTTPVLNATTTYYIEVSRAGCAMPVRIPVNVTVTPAVSAPVIASAPAICAGSSASLSVTNPDPSVTYKWYDASTGGTLLFTGSTFSTGPITANETYFVEAVAGTCTSAARTAVSVVVNPLPVLPQVQTSSTSIRSGQSAVLTATSTESNVGFNWYDSPNATTPVYVGSTFVTPLLTTTTSYFVEAVSNETGCASATRVQITITVDGTGTPDPILCGVASSQTNGVVGVSLLAGVFNEQLAIDNDANTGSSLIIPVGLLGGSVYQRLNFGAVSSAGDSVKVKITSPGRLLSLNVLPNIRITSYNGTASNNDGVALNSSLLRLQLLSGGEEALISFVPANPFTSVEVRLNSGAAGALSALQVNYAQRISAAPTVVAADVVACASQTATLQVSNPIAGVTYRWYDEAGAYIEGQDGASFTTPALTANTFYFVTASSSSSCESGRTRVNVTITPLPVAPQLVSTDINTCAGTDVVLQILNPVQGITYKWYDADGNYQAGRDGISFTVSAVTADTTFSVEAANNCGVSAQRTTATINIGTINPPVVTPATVTVSAGSPAVLTASSSTSGAQFYWYDQADGGTLLFTGAQFLTPSLSSTTTYYVEAVVPGGCPASGRTAVKVTVQPAGPVNPLACGGATTTVRSGTDGPTLFGGVFNPELAIDDQGATGSTLVIPVGALGASAYHHVGFNGLSNIGDTLRVRISNPGKLLSLGVLPGVTLTTFRGTVSNDDALVVTNPLINLELLSDNSAAIITYVPQSRFDGVELRLNSGLAGALSSINFNYAERINMAPVVEVSAVEACEGSSATLVVRNPIAGVAYRWSQGETYQTGKDGVTFNTPIGLAAGTYQFSVLAFANGCESAPVPVEVVVLPLPAPPVPATTNPPTACIGTSVNLAVQPVTGIAFNWFDAPTGGNALAVNTTTYTTPANLAAGAYEFYVEAANSNSCSNTSRTKISLTINPSALASDIAVSGGAPICGGSTTTLTASSTTVSNPVFTWYTDAALTNAVFTGAVFVTPELSATTIYYVSVSGSNKCANTPSDAKAVTVVINPTSVASDIMLSGLNAGCEGSSITLTASSSTVVNPVFTWYSDAALTNSVFVGASFTTPVLSATTTYYVTVKGDNKCENTAASAKAITLNINPVATGDDLIISSPASICEGSTAILSASSTTVINPIYTWYSDAALSTVVYVGSTFTTPALSATRSYYVTVKGDNRCESTAQSAKQVIVNVNDYATQADIAVSNANVCEGSSATLMASSMSVTNPVFTWYSDASLTDVVYTGPTFVTPALTATTIYHVTVRGSNKCENTAADAKVVTISVNKISTSTDIIIAGSTNTCAGSTVVLTASSSTVTNPVFTWYSDAALTNVAFVGAVFTTPALTANTTYYVTVKGDNQCENSSATAKVVAVTVSPVSNADDLAVADPAAICAGSSATLVASSSTVTNPVFSWYSDAALTNQVFIGSSFNTGSLNATTTYYVTVKGDNRCENTAAGARAVTVPVNQFATQADITVNNASVCQGTEVSLMASSSTVTNPVFNWYSDASLTNLVFTGATFEIAQVTGSRTLYVTVSGSNKCANTAADAKVVTITAKPISSASDILVNGSTTVCGTESVVLTASSSTVTNPVFTWYSDAALTNVAFVGAVFTTPALTANTTYYVTVKGDNQCENSSATAKVVAVTVSPRPVTPILSAAGTNICSGDNTTITIANAQDGVVYEWYTSASGGTLVHSGNQYVTPALNATVTYYVQAVSPSGCGNVTGRVAITIEVGLRPAVPMLTAMNLSICSGSGAVLSVANPVAGVTYTWYGSANGTDVLGSGETFTTPALTSNATFYVGASSGSCTSTSRTAANVTVSMAPAAPTSITGGASPLCSASSALLVVENPDASVIYRWYTASIGGTPIHEGPSFNTPALNETTIYYVESVSSTTGCSSSTRTPVSVNVLPVLPAPVVSVQASSAISITFSWNAVTGATGYEVSLDGGNTWQVPSSGPSGTTHLVSGLQPDQDVTIRVRAKGQLDCQLSAATTLTARADNPLGNEVFVPNTFTPNGDGRNDMLMVYGNTIAKMRLRIYNQWGEFIYESVNVSNGWDGTYKGQMQPNGVYVYLVEVNFNDGSKATKKGTVTLLR